MRQLQLHDDDDDDDHKVTGKVAGADLLLAPQMEKKRKVGSDHRLQESWRDRDRNTLLLCAVKDGQYCI